MLLLCLPLYPPPLPARPLADFSCPPAELEETVQKSSVLSTRWACMCNDDLPPSYGGFVQASTMRIFDRYIVEGAPMFIPLSPSCRDEILSSKASSVLIFGRARQEVMGKLGGGEVTYCVSGYVHIRVGSCFHASSDTPRHFAFSLLLSWPHTYIDIVDRFGLSLRGGFFVPREVH